MSDFDWEPTVDDVGALLRARTKDNVGAELGTFTADTRPTDDEVTLIIDKATAQVAARCGATTDNDICNDELKADASDVAALRAAMRVELSYFPEQVRTDTSPYDRLKAEFDEDVKALAEAVAETCGLVGGGEGIGSQGTFPSASFPEAENWGGQVW